MDVVDKQVNDLDIVQDNVKTEKKNETEPSASVQTAVTSSSEIAENPELSMIENLTEGFCIELLPQLQDLREKTREVTKNQTVLMETMQQEIKKFSGNKEIEEFTKMISIVQMYYIKLKNIKTEMDQIDERMARLKKRSLKLKERRKKQDMDEKQKRERELALERELTAQPAT